MPTVAFRAGNILTHGADLTVLPCSAQAHISEEAASYIQRYGFPRPNPMPLGSIQVIPFTGPAELTRWIAYAASVINFRSSTDALFEIGARIGQYVSSRPEIRTVEAPLLGTGAGQLEPTEAGTALRNGFLSGCTDDTTLLIYSFHSSVARALTEAAQTSRSRKDMSHIFLSYSREDFDFAENLAVRLEQAGVQVWRDVERLHPGVNWRQDIDDALRSADAVIVVISPASKKSEYVTYEWAYAVGVGISVIPVLLEDTELHPRLELLQFLDFRVRNARPWERLISRVTNLPPVAPGSGLLDATGNEPRVPKDNDAILARLIEALEDPRYKWRTVEKVAAAAAISEEEATQILRANPKVRFSRNPRKEIIVGLRTRTD